MSEFGNKPAEYLNKLKETLVEGGYTKLENSHIEAMVANVLGRTESYGGLALKAAIDENMNSAARTKVHLANAASATVRQFTSNSVCSIG